MYINFCDADKRLLNKALRLSHGLQRFVCHLQHVSLLKVPLTYYHLTIGGGAIRVISSLVQVSASAGKRLFYYNVAVMSDFNLVDPRGWEYDLQSVRALQRNVCIKLI